MSCAVCGGVGFVKAAPISTLPTTLPGGRVVVSRNVHRRAMWPNAVVTPCWVCAAAPVKGQL